MTRAGGRGGHTPAYPPEITHPCNPNEDRNDPSNQHPSSRDRRG